MIVTMFNGTMWVMIEKTDYIAQKGILLGDQYLRTGMMIQGFGYTNNFTLKSGGNMIYRGQIRDKSHRTIMLFKEHGNDVENEVYIGFYYLDRNLIAFGKDKSYKEVPVDKILFGKAKNLPGDQCLWDQVDISEILEDMG